MPAEKRQSYITTDQSLLNGEPIIRGTKTPVFDALRYYAENQQVINRFIALNRVPDELVHPAVQAHMTQVF